MSLKPNMLAMPMPRSLAPALARCSARRASSGATAATRNGPSSATTAKCFRPNPTGWPAQAQPHPPACRPPGGVSSPGEGCQRRLATSCAKTLSACSHRVPCRAGVQVLLRGASTPQAGLGGVARPGAQLWCRENSARGAPCAAQSSERCSALREPSAASSAACCTGATCEGERARSMLAAVTHRAHRHRWPASRMVQEPGAQVGGWSSKEAQGLCAFTTCCARRWACACITHQLHG